MHIFESRTDPIFLLILLLLLLGWHSSKKS